MTTSASSADKPSVTSSNVTESVSKSISDTKITTSVSDIIANESKIIKEAVNTAESKVEEGLIKAPDTENIMAKVVSHTVKEVNGTDATSQVPIVAVVEDVAKLPKRGLFGTIFRRGKSATPTAPKSGSEEIETTTDDAEPVPDNNKRKDSPETSTKDVGTAEVEVSVEPPSEPIKSPKSPKLFPFSKKKSKKTDSGPVSPNEEVNGLHGTSTSSPILPNVVVDTKSPVVPVGETPVGLDKDLKEAPSAYESVSKSTSQKDHDVKNVLKPESNEAVTAAVVEPVEEVMAAADVSAEEKKKAGLFGRFPLHRKKDTKHDPSTANEEVVIPQINPDESSEPATVPVTSASSNSVAHGISTKNASLSKAIDVSGPKAAPISESDALAAAQEEPSGEPEMPVKKEKRQSIIFGLLNSMTLRRNTSEEAPPLPTNNVDQKGAINVPDKGEVDVVSENEEVTESSHGQAASKPVSANGGSTYGPSVRSSYLLKPTALTRAIHRRHFTLHQSGEIVMRMNALDLFESKVYVLTTGSELFVPASPKIDYELIVKLTEKKNISLVMGSEWEREAWAASLTDVIEKMKANSSVSQSVIANDGSAVVANN